MLKRSFLPLLAALAFSTGCSASGMGRSGLDHLVQPAVRPATSSSRSLLYVVNSGAKISSVTVYNPAKPKPIRTITNGISNPSRIAFDAAGNFYVGNYSSVSVYAPGGSSPIRTLKAGLNGSGGLAFDSTGALYVAGEVAVNVFAPGASRPERTIYDGIRGPTSLAFDASMNLYVADADGGAVTVYAAGTTSRMRTIRHLIAPLSLGFDSSGNLYVADIGDGYGRGAKVVVYGPGSSVPLRVIRDGVPGPNNLMFDSTGMLYVTNNLARLGTLRGFVSVYAPGSEKAAYKIERRVFLPGSAALDAQGNLYVANGTVGGAGGDVTLYARGSRKLLKTMRDGIDGPRALAIWPR